MKSCETPTFPMVSPLFSPGSPMECLLGSPAPACAVAPARAARLDVGGHRRAPRRRHGGQFPGDLFGSEPVGILSFFALWILWDYGFYADFMVT